jgi:hypothetical protein
MIDQFVQLLHISTGQVNNELVCMCFHLELVFLVF